MAAPNRQRRCAGWVLRSVLQPILVVLLAAAGAGAAMLVWHPKAPALSLAAHEEGALSAGDARALPGVLWVDARERSEFEASRIPGAVLLNESEWDVLLPEFVGAWDFERPLVVYCGSDLCPSARRVRERLMTELQLEPGAVRYLKGGLLQWTEPLER